MSCKKRALTEREANAYCHSSAEVRRAYFCPGCKAWHTTTTQRGDATQLRPIRTKLH